MNPIEALAESLLNDSVRLERKSILADDDERKSLEFLRLANMYRMFECQLRQALCEQKIQELTK